MAAPRAASGLLHDVDQAIARRSEESRSANLQQMTELFVREAPGLDGERVGVFDEVIGRLAAGANAETRAALATRLADVPNAPPRVVRSLARDEIKVAAPLLARSSRLTDEDLATIAAAKGREHRLAITERACLSETVTDALVNSGDRVVAHAVACNPGARLSEAATSALVDRANADGTLRTLLTGRHDLPEDRQQQLAAVRGESSGRAALALDVEDEEGRARLGRALAAVQMLADLRPLAEEDLVSFLDGDEIAEAVCALALMAGLPVSTALRLFEPGRHDLLLLVARSQGWAWETTRRLLALQAGEAAEVDPGLRPRYAALEVTTAGRVIHALASRTRQARPEPRQIRTKVR